MDSTISLKHHAIDFAGLLDSIQPGLLPVHPYAVEYLRHLLENKEYYLAIYVRVLEDILHVAAKDKKEIILVDYGAGVGLLGLFAKFAGFGRVIMIEISPEFFKTEQLISDQLKIQIDEILCGDANQLENLEFGNGVPVIAGTDVIEHIYDLDHFFSVLSGLQPDPVLVFTTAANAENYFKSRQIIRVQRKDELQGWPAGKNNSTEIEGSPPFRMIRKEIILNCLQSPGPEVMDQMIKCTRGLNRADIIKACQEFDTTGNFPREPEHPTNTCDPITGSWSERLLSVKEYQELFSRHGFTLRVRNGFYNSHGNTIKSIAARLLNFMIFILGKRARFMSPFIEFIGRKKS